VLGDGDRLAQVFTNLIDNALKFTPAGGRVTIALGSVDGGVQVSVRDTGPGIEADQLERVFERFYQVDRSRRGGTGRGVGLGLAIAHQIVIAHAGKIWVESHPGQGSCFMVKLPLARADNSSIPTNPKGRG
jgi:two-component system phosphate regulon sensor histidine kinase PhoR